VVLAFVINNTIDGHGLARGKSLKFPKNGILGRAQATILGFRREIAQVVEVVVDILSSKFDHQLPDGVNAIPKGFFIKSTVMLMGRLCT